MRDKSLHKFDNIVFNENLLRWYKENKRILPWRETKDPYAIWVSEIMLQQTKVDTVIDYYHRFMDRFPTVFDLAEADEQEVLKEWEGLGYYSRARNLHTAAQDVVQKYGGKIPNDPEELGDLKGIGPYTRGAISSIAYGLPEPAVDGNVMRVLSRVLFIEDNISDGRTRKRFEGIIREIISKEDPSSFNQALMELGALVCIPTSPACLLCPVQQECRAFAEGKAEMLPIKLKKKKPKKVAYDVFIIYDELGHIAVEQRPSKGLLANMWQFMMVDASIKKDNDLATYMLKTYGLSIEVEEKIGHVNHVFTHLIWDLTVWRATCTQKTDEGKQEPIFMDVQSLDQLPFSVSHLNIKEMLKVPLNTNE